MQTRLSNFVPADPRPVLDDATLYFGAGGRVTCGRHAGASARFTGRTIHGERVEPVRDEDRADLRRSSPRLAFECDSCPRAEVRP